jgi:hypothetical protein
MTFPVRLLVKRFEWIPPVNLCFRLLLFFLTNEWPPLEGLKVFGILKNPSDKWNRQAVAKKIGHEVRLKTEFLLWLKYELWDVCMWRVLFTKRGWISDQGDVACKILSQKLHQHNKSGKMMCLNQIISDSSKENSVKRQKRKRYFSDLLLHQWFKKVLRRGILRDVRGNVSLDYSLMIISRNIWESLRSTRCNKSQCIVWRSRMKFVSWMKTKWHNELNMKREKETMKFQDLRFWCCCWWCLEDDIAFWGSGGRSSS